MSSYGFLFLYIQALLIQNAFTNNYDAYLPSAYPYGSGAQAVNKVGLDFDIDSIAAAGANGYGLSGHYNLGPVSYGRGGTSGASSTNAAAAANAAALARSSAIASPGGITAGSGGFSGVGNGEISAAGTIDALGTSLISGNLPVMGSVSFEGSLPASGIVYLTGNCGCAH